MYNIRIQELVEKIAELKKRWPAHSVSPIMMRELDDLEEKLAETQKQAQKNKDHGKKDNPCGLPCL
jgi:hypothetical protein